MYYFIDLPIKLFLVQVCICGLRSQVIINNQSELMMLRYANVFAIEANIVVMIENAVNVSECLER